MERSDKQYCVLSAIYRMLRLKKINPQQATGLLETRAFYNEYMAKAIMALWLKNSIFKDMKWG